MRNRYLDLLRAAAVFRVVIYHVTGWPALTIVFPAMSVMFALGFAHHDGILRRRAVPWAAGAIGLCAAGWILAHPGPRGYDLNDNPLGNALWSAAFILAALRLAPVVRENRLVTVLNYRALTVYLWHVPLLVVITHAGEDAGWPIRGPLGVGWRLVVVFALVALAVLAVGWVEDFAAGRRPVLLPRNVTPRRQDGHHDVHARPGPSHVLRARIRQHPRRIPHLGREHDLPARRRAEQLPGVRR
jgi:peptidoglycan/LPS O-acetylase OafA/YrhL